MAKQRQNPDFRPTRIVQPVTSPVEQFYNPAGLAQLASFQNEMQIAQAFSGLSQSLQGFAQTYTQAEIEKGEREFLADAADSLKVRQKATEMIEQYGAIAPWRVRAYLTIMGGRQYGDQYAREAYAAIDSLSEPYGPNGEVRTDETVARELQDIAGKIETTSNFYVQTGFNQRREQVNSEIMGRVQAQRVEKARKLTEGAVVTEVMAAIDNTQDPEVMRRSAEERIKAARSTGTLADGGRAAIIAAIMQAAAAELDGPDPNVQRAIDLLSIFQADPDKPELGLSGLPLNAEQAAAFRNVQDRIRDSEEIVSNPERLNRKISEATLTHRAVVDQMALDALAANPFYTVSAADRPNIRSLIAEKTGIALDTTDVVQRDVLNNLTEAFVERVRTERAAQATEQQTLLADLITNRERQGEPLTDEELADLPHAISQGILADRASGYNGQNSKIALDFAGRSLDLLATSVTPENALTRSEQADRARLLGDMLSEILGEFGAQMRGDLTLREMNSRKEPTEAYILDRFNAFFKSKEDAVRARMTGFLETTGNYLAAVSWEQIRPAADMEFNQQYGERGLTDELEPPEMTEEMLQRQEEIRSSVRSIFNQEIEAWKQRQLDMGNAPSLEYLRADLEDIKNRTLQQYRKRLEASQPVPYEEIVAAVAQYSGLPQAPQLTLENAKVDELLAAGQTPDQELTNRRNSLVYEVREAARITANTMSGRYTPPMETYTYLSREGIARLWVPKDNFVQVRDGKLVTLPLPYRTLPDGSTELIEVWSDIIVGDSDRSGRFAHVSDNGDHYVILGRGFSTLTVTDLLASEDPPRISMEMRERINRALGAERQPASPVDQRRFMMALSLSDGLPLEEMLVEDPVLGRTVGGLKFQPGLPPRNTTAGLDLELGAPDPRYYLYGTDAEFMGMAAEVAAGTTDGIVSMLINEVFDNQISPQRFIELQSNLRRNFSPLN